MDLNIDNYSIPELLDIFEISSISTSNPLNINILQKHLYNKHEQIKILNKDEILEEKEDLMEFYTKGFFKLLKNIITINGQYNNNSSKLDDPLDAFGNKQGNNYNEDNVNKTSISIEDNLLPPLMPNQTIKENNNFVYKHKDQISFNSFPSHLKSGIINPLTRKSYIKHLNINSRFRNNFNTTTSTQFDFYLPNPIKKVVSMKVINTIFPKMVYTVSDQLGSNFFYITTVSGLDLDDPNNWTLVSIPNGSYTADTIVETINNKLSLLSSPINNIRLEYDINNGKMTFNSLPTTQFSLRFGYNFREKDLPNCNLLQIKQSVPSNVYKDQFTLGWLLGFRGEYIKNIESTKIKKSTPYSSSSTVYPYTCACDLEKNLQNLSLFYSNNNFYTAEGLYDLYGTRYFLLAIDDFQNNHDIDIIISPFQFETIADTSIMAKISTECNSCIS